jgi:hypothetical protein
MHGNFYRLADLAVASAKLITYGFCFTKKKYNEQNKHLVTATAGRKRKKKKRASGRPFLGSQGVFVFTHVTSSDGRSSSFPFFFFYL